MGGSTDNANTYMTVLDGQSNQRFNNFIANQDPFLCTLQDQDNLTNSILKKTSAKELASDGDSRHPHYCKIDCGKDGCGGPVDDPSLRYDYQAGHDVLAKNKDEGPIVEQNGQPISYVGHNGKAWFEMFINKPCWDKDANATASSCLFLDFRQCAWVRNSGTEQLTGDTTKVYNACLQARITFEREFISLGIEYDNDKSNTDVLEKIMKFMPHAIFDKTKGNYGFTLAYKPLTEKYENITKPEFYFEASADTGAGEGIIVESEVPIYMNKLKDAKTLDAPPHRYERGPKAFGNEFLAVYASHANCTEQLGDDAPEYCDQGDFGYSGPKKDGQSGTSINSVLTDNDDKTSWYKLSESTACWTADQISRELNRFIPVMSFQPLHAQITPGALNQWRNKTLIRPKHVIHHFVNCCNVFMRTKNDEDIENTFKDLINDNEYYKKGKHKVICP